MVASFTITLKILDFLQPLCPSGRTVVLAPPYQKVGDMAYAYIATLPELVQLADNDTSPARSPVVVCEGKYSMGPAHTLHAEIGSLGRGRFSHVTGGVVFSTSDNSDPNSNGKRYIAVVPKTAN